jgi:hypothetical protein
MAQRTPSHEAHQAAQHFEFAAAAGAHRTASVVLHGLYLIFNDG